MIIEKGKKARIVNMDDNRYCLGDIVEVLDYSLYYNEYKVKPENGLTESWVKASDLEVCDVESD